MSRPVRIVSLRGGSRIVFMRQVAKHDVIRVLDSYASLLVLLLANFSCSNSSTTRVGERSAARSCQRSRSWLLLATRTLAND